MVGLIATFVVLIGAALFVFIAKIAQGAGSEAVAVVMGASLVFVMTDIVVIALLTAGILQWFLTRTTDLSLARRRVAHDALPGS